MKTILHFANYNILEKVPKDVISIAHLVTYDIDYIDNKYNNRVKVYKNRYGNQGDTISQEQLRILQHCVMNDKPQPEFMKSNAQKARDAINRMEEKDKVIIFYTARLAKLEEDLFPYGYYDWPGMSSSSLLPLEVRFSRVEKMLDIDISPNKEITLERLEKCENHLDNIKVRLRNLDAAVFSNNEEISRMKSVITLEGQINRLEDKINIKLPFKNISNRLDNIETTWACLNYYNYLNKKVEDLKNTQYVCPVLKHQHALQDALQDKFGKKETYAPKFKDGDIVTKGEIEFKISSVGHICGFPVYYIGNHPTNCKFIDTNFTLKSTTYVPKYSIGGIGI